MPHNTGINLNKPPLECLFKKTMKEKKTNKVTSTAL